MAERSKARIYSRSLAGIEGSNPAEGMDVCLVSCVVCDGPITRPEESYRQCCVIVCDLEISRMRRPGPELGCCARGGELALKEQVCHKYEIKLTIAIPTHI